MTITIYSSGAPWSPGGANELPCKLTIDVRMYRGGSAAIISGQYSLAIPRGGSIEFACKEGGR